MSIAHVLSDNVKLLMKLSRIAPNPNAVATRGKVGVNNVRRVVEADSHARIDTVEGIATALGFRPCDLLDPDLPKRLQAGQTLELLPPQPPVVDAVHWRETAPSVRALVEELLTRAQSGRLSEELVAVLQGVLRIAAQPLIENRPLGAPIAPEFQAALQEQSEHGEREQQKRAGRSVSHG